MNCMICLMFVDMDDLDFHSLDDPDCFVCEECMDDAIEADKVEPNNDDPTKPIVGGQD